MYAAQPSNETNVRQYLGAPPTATSPRDVSPIDVELTALEHLQRETEAAFFALTDRLAIVTNPETPQPCAEDKRDDDLRPRLLAVVSELRERQHELLRRINSLTSRLVI